MPHCHRPGHLHTCNVCCPLIPHVEHLPSGGVRIIVADDASDSLAILTVANRDGELRVEVGLRGNYDVKQRPMRRVFTSMRAPKVSPAARAQRKARWLSENAWRLR